MSKYLRTPAQRAFFDLCEKAFCDIPGRERAEWAHRTGKPLPEDVLPGRFLMKQPPEVRALIATLTSEEIANIVHRFLVEPDPKEGKKYGRAGRQRSI